MNRSIFLLMICLIAGNLLAQDAGTIWYEEDITFNLPPEVAIRIKDAPKSRQKQMILAWDDHEVSYINNPSTQDDRSVRRRGNTMFIRGSRKSIKYLNYQDSTVIEEKEMMNREFSIRDSLPEITWKVDVSSQRDIIGYTCMKASTTVDTIDVVAWWTPEIPVSYGPDGYGGLPGVVLALGYGENKAILAKRIELNTDSTEQVVLLEESKKTMDRAEYDLKMEERHKEMQKMWGGSRKRGKTRR